MTKTEAMALIQQLTAAFPSKTLSPESSIEYARSIFDLSASSVAFALEALKVTSNFFPSICQLRQTAIDAEVGDKIPTAEAAWAEINTHVRTIGSSRSWREPPWSHPLVQELADAMGWEQLCLSQNALADRAHMLKMYESVSNKNKMSRGMTPEGLALMQILAGPTKQLAQPLQEALNA